VKKPTKLQRCQKALDAREDQMVALIRKHERMVRRYGWLEGANRLRDDARELAKADR